jgi:Arc/MetJ-type ribon-helix-helix transcriptional regulator
MKSMTEVAIQIPDDLKPFIDHSVKLGLFDDAADFVLNLLHNVKAESEAELTDAQKVKLAALRAEINIGIAEADRGEFVEFNAADIIAEGLTRRAAVLS